MSFIQKSRPKKRLKITLKGRKRAFTSALRGGFNTIITQKRDIGVKNMSFIHRREVDDSSGISRPKTTHFGTEIARFHPFFSKLLLKNNLSMRKKIGAIMLFFYHLYPFKQIDSILLIHWPCGCHLSKNMSYPKHAFGGHERFLIVQAKKRGTWPK